MIDLSLLRKQHDQLSAAIQKKDPSFPVDELTSLDQQRRDSVQRVEELRAQKNDLAQQAKSGITPELRDKSIEVGKQLKAEEAKLEELERQFNALILSCPNVPFDDVPEGNKESNEVIKEVGEKPNFSFPVKHHVDLGVANGWFDFEAAAVMTGSQFVYYKEPAVKLMYALTMFMLKNNMKHGFSPSLPPYLVNEKSLEVAGNFPKFRDDVYGIEGENLYLTPTAEVNLSNVYRDTIIPGDQLPKRMTSWTSCFRKEAGNYGANERGLIRIHQFEKVELYTVCKPEDSASEQERMLACAEDILQQLGLHYRVSLLAAQDCSFSSAKTYDIEVWMPGQGAYYEVSSTSNCTDFQARRGKIRYKDNPQDKAQLVHTLNGSSLALPRLIVALLETYQQEDGTVLMPDVLQGYGLL